MTVNEINLKLIDAAKRDIVEAMKFDRALKFGEGIKSYGTGPSSYERVGLDVRGQKKRAREYGEEIANDIENSEEFGAKRRKEWRKRSKDKTASVRVERCRSTRSKTFLNSLKKAKDNKHAGGGYD